MTKFLIIGDLHGNKPNIYRKDFDAIIAPGDFCSDSLRKYMFQALKEQINNPESRVKWYNLAGKENAKKMIQKSLKDGRKILEFLNSFNKPVFALPGNWDWTGDKDWSFLNKDYWKSYFIKGLRNIRNCHKNKFKFKDLTIIGHGITSSPEYPVKEKIKNMTKKEIEKAKREYKKSFFSPMSKLFQKAKKKDNLII